jgi:hypothetical protein
LHRSGISASRPGANWYAKPSQTFSAALAVVHRRLWRPEGFATSRSSNDLVKLPSAFAERLIETLCHAA